ncbi:MAG: His/Gly/Thr/Pro-type tRNA ligase C-terminal domain-containing protein [Vicinamibacterales bacterium]
MSDVPACGIRWASSASLVVMGERGIRSLVGLGRAPADVMVTVWNADGVADALALAAELRSAGLAVEVYPEADKIGRQFKYAASRAVPFVTVVGDDEAAQGLVTLKNLATGEQRTLSRAEAPLAVKAGLPAS